MFWNQASTMSPNDTETGYKTCPYCAEEVQPQAVKCKHCLSWIGPKNQGFGLFNGFNGRGGAKPSEWRLTRTVQDRKIFGVCGGIARSMGVDPTIVRVVFALTTVFSFFVPGIIAYAILAWAIPNEDSYV